MPGCRWQHQVVDANRRRRCCEKYSVVIGLLGPELWQGCFPIMSQRKGPVSGYARSVGRLVAIRVSNFNQEKYIIIDLR